jgi:hypothetical protein
MSFKKGHANRVKQMDPIISFLNEHRDTYNELKKRHRPTTSVEPPGRYKANNVINASTILTSRSESSLLPPIETKGGGGRILGGTRK